MPSASSSEPAGLLRRPGWSPAVGGGVDGACCRAVVESTGSTGLLLFQVLTGSPAAQVHGGAKERRAAGGQIFLPFLAGSCSHRFMEQYRCTGELLIKCAAACIKNGLVIEVCYNISLPILAKDDCYDFSLHHLPIHFRNTSAAWRCSVLF